MNTERNPDWNELLGQVKGGQAAARENLYRELSVRLAAVAQYRLWGWPRQDLEDLVQDCICTVLQKLDQVDSNPHLYACQILDHKIGDALRRRSRIINTPLAADVSEEDQHRTAAANPAIHPEDDSDGFALRTEARDRVALVQNGIKRLSAFCRTFFLGVMEGQSVQELWNLFQEVEPTLQRSAFDKRIFDCRKRLKQIVLDQI